MPVVCSVVVEYQNEVAMEVVVKATEVTLVSVCVVVVPVVSVVARVTPRKFDAKSRLTPGQL
jgi:hypothetical protein